MTKDNEIAYLTEKRRLADEACSKLRVENAELRAIAIAAKDFVHNVRSGNVAHGAAHNDTICIAEIRLPRTQGELFEANTEMRNAPPGAK